MDNERTGFAFGPGWSSEVAVELQAIASLIGDRLHRPHLCGVDVGIDFTDHLQRGLPQIEDIISAWVAIAGSQHRHDFFIGRNTADGIMSPRQRSIDRALEISAALIGKTIIEFIGVVANAVKFTPIPRSQHAADFASGSVKQDWAELLRADVEGVERAGVGLISGDHIEGFIISRKTSKGPFWIISGKFRDLNKTAFGVGADFENSLITQEVAARADNPVTIDRHIIGVIFGLIPSSGAALAGANI